MKIIKSLLVGLLMVAFVQVNAQQRYYTKNGKIYFSASSSLETIEATNEKGTSVVDITNGALEFAILMKAFSFTKALMQEHFNENYVESDKYPKAIFKGSIVNLASVNLKKDGKYPVKISGKLTIHGVTNDLETTGTITVKNGGISAGTCDFSVLLADYNIIIPSLVKDKISKEVKINIDVKYEPLKSSGVAVNR